MLFWTKYYIIRSNLKVRGQGQRSIYASFGQFPLTFIKISDSRAMMYCYIIVLYVRYMIIFFIFKNKYSLALIEEKVTKDKGQIL